METAQLIGWAAVCALFATMVSQALKQWRDKVKHGLSKFFFFGQVTASTLFLAYSVMQGDRVFVVGNALVLAAAIAGGGIYLYNRHYR
jgi:MtN3 and saliva related transmembrane protein